MNRKQILDYFADTNTAYIHSNGKNATNSLIQILDCQANEDIIEIGTGTGATIITLASRYKSTRFYGVDISNLMFNKTFSRIKFCRLEKRIFLKPFENPRVIPFESNFFDKVYAESVLGIQEDDQLITILKEIIRILKPGGRLFLNESVWLESISTKEITSINDFCKKEFGIIQANCNNIEQWRKLLAENKFNIIQLTPIDKIVRNNSSQIIKKEEILSKIYTLLGKLKGLFNRELKKEYAEYKKNMAKVFEKKQYLVGLFIVASK